MNQTQTRITTQRVEDLHRLADQAERKGVRLLVDHRTGQHVATSASNPTTCHQVDVNSCTCKGFSVWHRCMHHSLLLAELGLIPDVEPVVTDVVILDEQPAPCRSCRGEGSVRAYVGGGLSDWIMVPCGCRAVASAA